VMVMLLIALAIVPGLITTVVDTVAIQKAGGGGYSKGTSKFVVVIGPMDRVSRIIDLMETFLDTVRKRTVFFLT
jgi:hypothetical protein